MRDRKATFYSGLGFGLIIGALLLELMNASKSAQTDHEDLAKLAEQNGYKLVAKTDKLYTEDEVAKAIQEAKGKATAPSPIASPNTAQSLVPSASPAATPAASSSPSPAAAAAIQVTIPEGSGSKEVASLLLQKGVIKDAASFEKKIRDKGFETKINRGDFTFYSGMTDDQIIDAILVRTR